MNTLLTYMRTVNHPNTVTNAFNRKMKLVAHLAHRSNTLVYSWLEDSLYFATSFKNNNLSYSFVLYKNFYNMSIAEAYNPNKLYLINPPLKTVVNISEIRYDEIEETLFQQSLIHDLRQFKDKEAEMLVRLRNTYFGEKS